MQYDDHARARARARASEGWYVQVSALARWCAIVLEKAKKNEREFRWDGME